MISVALPLLTFSELLRLACCDVQQLPSRPLLYNNKCSAVRVWYVVCGGLEKHSKHKINVSKHFNNVGEKCDFYWFHLNRVSCVQTGQEWQNGWSSCPCWLVVGLQESLSPVLSCMLGNPLPAERTPQPSSDGWTRVWKVCLTIGHSRQCFRSRLAVSLHGNSGSSSGLLQEDDAL